MTPAEEEHYTALCEALRDLWDGTADEEQLAMVCAEMGIDIEGVLG